MSKKQIEFNKLNNQFKSLIRWVEGERNKSYAGSKQNELEKYYNAKIREGRSIARKLKYYSQSKALKNLQYFNF